MAIKGKSKPKARKTVTSGPKPAYVERKRPLFLRRGFQIGVIIALVVFSTTGIAYGLHREQQRQAASELKAAEAKYVGQFKSQVLAALSGVGQPSQASGFDVLPDMTAAVSGLTTGDTAPTDAAHTAKTAADSAKKAYTELGQINTTRIIGGHGFDQVLARAAFNAQSGMVNGLKIYERVAKTLEEAASASGSERRHLLEAATGFIPTAKAVFGKGYLDFTDVQNSAGIFSPPQYPAGGGIPPGVPPGAVPPGGVPPGAVPPGAVPPGGAPPAGGSGGG